MIAQINHSKLILQENADVQYTFDKTGRLTNIRHGHRYIARGFDGSMVAHTWHRGHHQTDPLSDEETRTLISRSRETLQKAQARHDLFLSDPLSTDDVLPWFERALSFQPEKDRLTFHEVYRPVGILPPDQYAAVVLQVSESCAWNRCSFCSFYKGKPFHLKTFEQFARHVQDVRNFIGEEISARNSIFLGEANAMAAPVDLLIREMDHAADRLVPSMADFRGFYSFLEPGQTPEISGTDWRRLRDAGLRRIYLGLETGCGELRETLGKTGSVEDV
ncbi:MAG TPA: hypothetical protein PK876_10940, partial [Elusimicrobiota bacterium]|nr:hypothetical protein [Elusimicrobiota bacterium]